MRGVSSVGHEDCTNVIPYLSPQIPKGILLTMSITPRASSKKKPIPAELYGIGKLTEVTGPNGYRQVFSYAT